MDNDMCPILADMLRGVDPELLKTSPEYRRALTRMNPLLFAGIYLPHHVQDVDTGKISFSKVHVDWAAHALEWAKPGTHKPRENRKAFIAPRAHGKSTCWQLLFVLWAAAFGYTKFTVTFSATDTMAQQHLDTLRRELDQPESLLRLDFPELCQTRRSPNGREDGNSRSTRNAANGWTLMAKGLDVASLGLKKGRYRPDLLIIDDGEPMSGYSIYQAEQRLATLQSAILELNQRARVVLVGTTTLYGSITHSMIRYARGDIDGNEWVGEDKWQVFHALPTIIHEDGREESVWERNPIFALDNLRSMMGTRNYALNYLNDPMAADTLFWAPTDFKYADFACESGTYLSIDPIITKNNAKSDYCGVAVVGCTTRPYRRCLVKFAAGIKKTGKDLADYVSALLQAYPEINCLLLETNAGGEGLWEEVFEDIPIKKVFYTSSTKKDDRITALLAKYQNRPEPQVYHVEQLSQLETQMITHPGKNDDIIDAVASAVNRWVTPERRIRVRKGSITPR